MNVFNDLGGSVLVLVMSAAAALVAAVCIFVLITFLGARFSDELSYGVPLRFAPLLGFAMGGVVFGDFFERCALRNAFACRLRFATEELFR
jgi:hypothetical protein